jgi:hypothetical protein
LSIGTLAKEKYFSHWRNQLNGSSPEKVGKSSLGLAMDKLNCGWVFLFGCCLGIFKVWSFGRGICVFFVLCSIRICEGVNKARCGCGLSVRSIEGKGICGVCGSIGGVCKWG